MSAPVIITVDGASGSGKTTLGRRLAHALALRLVDTGLVYRGITVAAVRAGIRPTDTEQLIELARTTRLTVNTDSAENPNWLVRVDGVDAERELRNPSHATLLSTLSQIPEVRAALLPLQRDLARGGAVAVGRDCGTVVFPGARVKFYLVAAAEVRMTRRRAQLLADGTNSDAETVANDVAGRDRIDSPAMTPADDVHIIDTGRLDADTVFVEALNICAAAGVA